MPERAAVPVKSAPAVPAPAESVPALARSSRFYGTPTKKFNMHERPEAKRADRTEKVAKSDKPERTKTITKSFITNALSAAAGTTQHKDPVPKKPRCVCSHRLSLLDHAASWSPVPPRGWHTNSRQLVALTSQVGFAHLSVREEVVSVSKRISDVRDRPSVQLNADGAFFTSVLCLLALTLLSQLSNITVYFGKV